MFLLKQAITGRSKQGGYRRNIPVAAITMAYESKRPQVWRTPMAVNVSFVVNERAEISSFDLKALLVKRRTPQASGPCHTERHRSAQAFCG